MKVKEWTKALRSGKYKQGAMKLRSMSGNYCCIGVCLDLMGAKWDIDDEVNGCVFGGDYIDNQSLPKSIEFEGIEFPKERLRILAQMNDEGRSFDKIADKIEEWHEKD